MSEWRPIKTAPRDGTWVLLAGGSVASGWEKDRPVPPAVVAQYSDWKNGETVDGHWQFAWYDGGCYGEYVGPTYWQPVLYTPEGPA